MFSVNDLPATPRLPAEKWTSPQSLQFAGQEFDTPGVLTRINTTMISNAQDVGSPAQGLREAFFRHAHAMLQAGHEDPAAWSSLRQGLEEWGFDLSQIELLPLGFFPSAQSLRHKLRQDGFTTEEIRASSLLEDSRLAGRLIGPIRDCQGRILSFWARPARLEGTRCLYLNRQWRQQTAVFGLDVAMSAVAHGNQDLVLVEDVLDALLLESRGLRNVAALGTSPAEMTPDRWQRLAELGIHRTTLAMDSLRTSANATLTAVENAAQASLAPAVYVLPPEALAGSRGPWELVRSMGPEVLGSVLASGRIHGFQYLAAAIAARHGEGRPWTDATRRAALHEARRFYGAAHQRNVPQLDAFFLPAILQELGLSHSTFVDDGGLAWLEDGPSEDAWALGDAGNSAADTAQSMPVLVEPEPEPLEPAAILAQDAASSQAEPDDFCEFHQCDRKVCLCWD